MLRQCMWDMIEAVLDSRGWLPAMLVLTAVVLGIGFSGIAWAQDSFTAGRDAFDEPHLFNSFAEWLKLGSGIVYAVIGFIIAGGLAYAVIKWVWPWIASSWDEALLVLDKVKRRLEWEKKRLEVHAQVEQMERQQKAWAAQNSEQAPAAAPAAGPQIIPGMVAVTFPVGPEPPQATLAEVFVFGFSLTARSLLILGLFAVGVTLALYM